MWPGPELQWWYGGANVRHDIRNLPRRDRRTIAQATRAGHAVRDPGLAPIGRDVARLHAERPGGPSYVAVVYVLLSALWFALWRSRGEVLYLVVAVLVLLFIPVQVMLVGWIRRRAKSALVEYDASATGDGQAGAP